MDALLLAKPDRRLQGRIALDGSKSLSNRALITLALAGADPARWLSRLSTSRDTATLLHLLQCPGDTWDAGDAGTTFRFLTAYLALQPGVHILTGSARMRERPVGALVDALRALGADIAYLERDGYPPLRIGAPHWRGVRRVRVPAQRSSQFLSALLLIAPYLPGGLELIPEGALVSRPYLEMTLRLMRHFGAEANWQGPAIAVAPGAYRPRPLMIEADWSAASYWYAMAALADTVDLPLEGLSPGSWQGDAVLATMMARFGVQTIFEDNCAVLRRQETPLPAHFEWDFLECPDIAQTLAVVCAGLGIPATFGGLSTLRIKETDRVAALGAELAKVGVDWRPVPGADDRFQLRGTAHWQTPPLFATYGDHRMAMAFAPLAMRAPVRIENPGVVAKSYPAFWEHLRALGFEMKEM